MKKASLIAVVAAESSKDGIGLNGELPWKGLKKDLQFFKRITTETSGAEGKQNAVLMGRRTWESIPAKHRPLPGRLNVVLTTTAAAENGAYPDAVVTAGSFAEALALCDGRDDVETICVIGGASLYAAAAFSDRCEAFYVTRISAQFPCDRWLPPVVKDRFVEDYQWQQGHQFHTDADASQPQLEKGTAPAAVQYRFTKLVRRPSAEARGTGGELQYLALVREILDSGVKRSDRTGTGTLSVFGRQLRFSLRDGQFPLLTTKRVFWRGVAEELLWFVQGRTNANELAAKNVHIWDANGSREFLDSRGLRDREVGDLGPVYGFQWRHFGAEYTDMHQDYQGHGVDQLAECVCQLRDNPTSRRILFSAWNPKAMPLMALPPCHILCQFYVANGELSAQMYQRSADMGLGVPFNIASYALLTYMVAHVTGLRPGEFVHVIGDAHVYLNHVDPLRQQLLRQPNALPTLKIKRTVASLDEFTMDDFELCDYKPQKTIKMDMAV